MQWADTNHWTLTNQGCSIMWGQPCRCCCGLSWEGQMTRLLALFIAGSFYLPFSCNAHNTGWPSQSQERGSPGWWKPETPTPLSSHASGLSASRRDDRSSWEVSIRGPQRPGMMLTWPRRSKEEKPVPCPQILPLSQDILGIQIS